jgi:cell division protease FtsH
LNDITKNLLIWLVILVVVVSVFQSFGKPATNDTIAYSEFITAVKENRVKDVSIYPDSVEGVLNDNRKFKTIRPMVRDDKLIDDLYNHNVNFEGRELDKPGFLYQLLLYAPNARWWWR